jgi:5-methylcytosine-specific restriction endonuclease McrA
MGLHGCTHGPTCPCYPKPSQKAGAKPPKTRQQLRRKPFPKKSQRKFRPAHPEVQVSWAEMSAEVLKRPLGGRCERCGKRQATDAHHRMSRAQGGPDTPSNLAAICRFCHDEVHEDPAAARPGGWIVPKGSDYRSRALILWDGTIATLDDQYGYSFQASMGG